MNENVKENGFIPGKYIHGVKIFCKKFLIVYRVLLFLNVFEDQPNLKVLVGRFEKYASLKIALKCRFTKVKYYRIFKHQKYTEYTKHIPF